jgi:hypothetical protein
MRKAAENTLFDERGILIVFSLVCSLPSRPKVGVIDRLSDSPVEELFR